jgi:recombinational DNA repair protein RecT
MKIVKFADGKWGIQKGYFLFKEFMDSREYNGWWTMPEHIHKYAKFESKDDCEEAMAKRTLFRRELKKVNTIIK